MKTYPHKTPWLSTAQAVIGLVLLGAFFFGKALPGWSTTSGATLLFGLSLLSIVLALRTFFSLSEYVLIPKSALVWNVIGNGLTFSVVSVINLWGDPDALTPWQQSITSVFGSSLLLMGFIAALLMYVFQSPVARRLREHADLEAMFIPGDKAVFTPPDSHVAEGNFQDSLLQASPAVIQMAEQILEQVRSDATAAAPELVKVKTAVVIPTSYLEEHGICVVEDGAATIHAGRKSGNELVFDLNKAPLELADRAVCETDPSIRQLIGYGVIYDMTTDRFFVYRRGKEGQEARLRDWSLGVGGHVDTLPEEGVSLIEHLKAELYREFVEEVSFNKPDYLKYYLNGVFEQKLFDYLVDNSDEVGRVHLGLLVILTIRDPSWIGELEAGNVEDGCWMTLEELQNSDLVFENWSMLAIQYLADTWPNTTHDPLQILSLSAVLDTATKAKA